jgi:hypothetical protein
VKASSIGNRHWLAVEGLDDTSRNEEQRVRVVVADGWASSCAGQLLTSCLVNLLCRQIGLVRHIEVAAPETPLLIRLPSGDSVGSFPASLETLATWAVNGAVPITTSRTPSPADQLVFVGEAPRNLRQGLLVVGEGWKAWAGEPFHFGPSLTPISRNPLGPFLAAALAAGEIFKRGRGIRRGRFLSQDGYSLWSGVSSGTWIDLDDGPEITGAALSPLHIVGTGAVGNALGYVLANLGLSRAYLILIDDDHYDDTNLNRCLLAGWLDRGRRKVSGIERALKAGGLETFAFPGTIRSYAADARSGLRADVELEVADLIFSNVVSCVDKGTSRQDVQGLRPTLLLGGSTLNLQAKSNLYRHGLGGACLGCFNPAEKDGEKLRALESQLREMSLDERGEFLKERGLDVKAIEEYLSGAQCGGLGVAALRDFATRSPASFSAGFVSLGAGLLLASTLLRSVLFPANKPARRDMTTLNFLNGGFMDAELAVDNACEQAASHGLFDCND